MQKTSLISIVLVWLLAACMPPVSTAAPPPATNTPAPTPTLVAENPPACAAANMVYHSQLRQVLMTGCIPTSGNWNNAGEHVIWGWNGEQWQRVAEGGPPLLVLGGAAYDEQRNVLVVYGGYSLQDRACQRETWEWDGTTWSKKDAESPSTCDHLEMAYDASRGQVILFGGGDENMNLGTETWAWDGETWTSISESGPPGRAHFGFVYDNTHEQTLLYGGYADHIMDDFWTLRDGEWQEINLSGPGPLSHVGMALEGNALLLFGGASSTSTFSSLSDKTWKLTDGAWSELELEDHPSPRGSPAMVYDPGRERVVLYGGFGADRKEFNDTWEWDGSQWQCMVNCQ